MRLTITLFLALIINVALPQVDQSLKNMQLYDGSRYVTYGHRITQVFSELEFFAGEGVFPKTNIAYLTYQQLIIQLQDTAKHNNWEQNKYNMSRNNISKNAPGGRLVLYVERDDNYATNNKMFFIIIRDTLENNLFQFHLPYRSPNLVSAYRFSNWAFIDIPVELPETFFVYVNNKTTKYLSDTKFLVQKNAAPINK